MFRKFFQALPVLLPLLQAQDDVCLGLLAGGVFDQRDVKVASANRERLRYLYCSAQADTRDKAKSLNASLKIVGKGEGLFGQNESEYQAWRTSLCSDSDIERESSTYASDQSKVASQAILDAFNACAKQDGLTQRAVSTSGDPSKFLWIFHYTPRNEKVNVVNVRPVWTVNETLGKTRAMSCTLPNGSPAPPTFLVGVGGRILSCSRNPCMPSLLSAEGDEEVKPKAITLTAIDGKSRDEPFVLVKTQTFNMTAPISVGDLPINSECTSSQEGAWHPHKFAPNNVNLCPMLSFGNGSASNDFDRGAYGDNDGSCTYRFFCRPQQSMSPSAPACAEATRGTQTRKATPTKK